jgi:septum formation protein
MARPPLVIYLASRSARRREYLKRLGIPFAVVRSAYREKTPARGNPGVIAVRHAVGKALAAKLPKRTAAAAARAGAVKVILGADTLVFFRGRVLGKPKSHAHAERGLAAMAGKAHWVYTALALRRADTGRMYTGLARTRVTFKAWGRTQIRNYVAGVRPLDKAAGYAIQHVPRIVAEYRGSRSNVVGMPLELFRKLLRKILRAGSERAGPR